MIGPFKKTENLEHDPGHGKPPKSGPAGDIEPHRCGRYHAPTGSFAGLLGMPGSMTDNNDTVDVKAALKNWRDSIDNIDAALIYILAERFRCTQEVGKFKAKYGLPPADPAREAEQIARLRQLAKDARLDADFAEKFLTFVTREVIQHHIAIKEKAR
jgi:chorismate mutase